MHSIDVNNIEALFFEQNPEFTVFVVENRFFLHSGRKYFEEKKENSKGFFDTEKKLSNFLEKNIFKVIFKIVKNPAIYISELYSGKKKLNLSEAITTLSKTFGAIQQHAAGPEIIDPIILFEEAISRAMLGQVVELYNKSIHKPRIIIVLRDNNYSRVSGLLGFAPHGTKIVYIKNDCSKIESYVFNSGAENVDDFVTLYSKQCYNSCSHTKTDLLYNPEWAGDSNIKLQSPRILKIRTQLMNGEKLSAGSDLQNTLLDIEKSIEQQKSGRDMDVLLSFLCFGKLFRVFCNDHGGSDIKDAHRIVEHLGNDVLKAHLYRYVDFMPRRDTSTAIDLLSKAEEIFINYDMEDHALYCHNNLLMKSFYSNEISIPRFKSLVQRARSNVPGLVGMPILINNLAVSCLYNTKFEDAVKYLDLALEYSPQDDHFLGISCNRIMAMSLYDKKLVNEEEIESLLLFIQNNFDLDKQSFLIANNLINLALSASQNTNLSKDIFELDLFKKTISIALTGPFGTESLKKQLAVIDNNSNLLKANRVIPKTGSRRIDFIQLFGFNPSIYNAWL